MEKELTRETVDPRYTWNLTRIYPTDEAWEEAFKEISEEAKAFAKRAGTLSQGRKVVLDALKTLARVDEKLSGLYAYAMMRSNEDSANAKYQAMNDRAGTLAAEVGAASAFLDPELLTLKDGEIEAMMADPDFAEFDRYLAGVLRMKEHTLSAAEEKLMAMAADACESPANAYHMLAYADMDLGKTRGENGEKVQLTDARLLTLLSSKDRAVRKAAYTNIMNGYNKYGNTIAATYAGCVKADIFNSRAHRFDSCRQAAMYPDEIDESVYDSLIDAVHGGIGTLNEYLSAYADALPSGEGYKLALANSIWLRDTPTLRVEKDFLQTNADYYGAQVYKAAFDGQTLRDINEWVRQNTDGSIDRVLEELPDEARLYLINTLSFDAEWEAGYKAADVRSGTFTALSGERRRAELMHSTESRYLNDGSATGFVKDYKGGKYSFAALLPNEGVSIADYVAGLTGGKLHALLNDHQYGQVEAAIPRFKASSSLELRDALKAMGVTDAFDSAAADLRAMGGAPNDQLYVGAVLHKTYLELDENGTKAAAVTAVATDAASAEPPEVHRVVLDRPFVYMIVDTHANLPLFLGTVTTMS